MKPSPSTVRQVAATATACLLAHLASAGEPAQPGGADTWIRGLKLELLPGESGRFAVIGASTQQVRDPAGRELPAQSQIYYLLDRALPINYLHWLASDDTHVLIDGGPVDYFLFHPDGRAERLRLGKNLAAGERPVITVPANTWKALVLAPGADFALMANALSPAWTPDRVKIGAGTAFLQRYTAAADWADETRLRELIGPNWKD
jgi:uncharacterized protein